MPILNRVSLWTLLTLPLLGACAHSSAPAPGTLAARGGLRAQALPIPATPQSWDYRIAQVVQSSAQQVVSQDGWDASPASVQALHGAGRKVICYFSAGTWEYDNTGRGIINRALTDRNGDGVVNGSGDPAEAAAVSAAIQTGRTSYAFGGQTLPLSADQRTFASLAGQKLSGWDEYVYRIGGFTATSPAPQFVLLRALMTGHMRQALAIGCDALEPDNIDAYANVRGGITAADQYAYNVWLATTGRGLGLPVYLKNDLDQIADGGEGVPPGVGRGLAHVFDGLINEECFRYRECERAAPFRDLGKPIFVREYSVKASCASYRAAKYGATGLTREQLADRSHLSVSVSAYGNGGRPDANANPPKCTFGTW